MSVRVWQIFAFFLLLLTLIAALQFFLFFVGFFFLTLNFTPGHVSLYLLQIIGLYLSKRNYITTLAEFYVLHGVCPHWPGKKVTSHQEFTRNRILESLSLLPGQLIHFVQWNWLISGIVNRFSVWRMQW